VVVAANFMQVQFRLFLKLNQLLCKK